VDKVQGENKMRPLREIMLQVHLRPFRELYGLKRSDEVSYDSRSEQIEVNGKPLYEVVALDDSLISRLRTARLRARDNLLKAHETRESVLHCQFDHELLALDHLVGGVEVITPRTFYEHVRIVELEVSAGRVSSQYYFSGMGVDHLIDQTNCRYKMVRVAEDWDGVVQDLTLRYDSLVTKPADLVYEEIKELRKDEMVLRCRVRKLPDPLRFLCECADYNEENRILRSKTMALYGRSGEIREEFWRVIEDRAALFNIGSD